MKNEIEVRTNKGEYSPGENICGAVYLRIVNPTGGTGVQMKFHGYAKFDYTYKRKGEPVGYKEQRDCINYPFEKLFQSDDSLSISTTAKLFPFKIELLRDIPGTFESRGENALARWRATVEYILEVEVINARELNKTFPIVIVQQPGRNVDLRASPEAISVMYEQTRFLLLKDIINITARLHQHVHRTGGNIKLRVIITNNSRIPVQSLRIKLFRKIILMCKQPILPEFETDENVDGNGNILDICVESDKPVGQEQVIDVSSRSELDCILYPLKESDGRLMCASVNCSCIMCEYKVCITANLGNGSSFDIFVPVPVINAPLNKKWKDWEPPFWLTDDDIEMVSCGDSHFQVSDNLLCKENLNISPFNPILHSLYSILKIDGCLKQAAQRHFQTFLASSHCDISPLMNKTDISR